VCRRCFLASGFRSDFIWIVPGFVVGAWLWRGWVDVFRTTLLGVLLFAVMVMGHGTFFHLPTPAQRTLSFLPGRWDAQVIQDARASSERRKQWWRDIVRYRMMEDWWRGDGFGLNKYDFESTFPRSTTGEALLLRGFYPHGLLTTIRRVGVVGLVLPYALLLAAGGWSIKVAKDCHGTVLFPVAVLAALHLTWWVVHYTFIYGSFPNQFVEFVFYTGMVRLLIQARRAWFSPDEDVAQSYGGPVARRA